jgi:hypothetical protein
MAAESGDWTWNDVVALLRDQPTGKKVALPVTSIAAPVGNGWYALPAGPDGCPVFGGGVDAKHGIIARVVDGHYEVHLCALPQSEQNPSVPVVASSAPQHSPKVEFVPSTPTTPLQVNGVTAAPALVPGQSSAQVAVRAQRESSVAHFIAERPGETVLLTTGLGTLIGALLGGARGALAGALAGGGAGMASVAISTAATSPMTSQVSGTLFMALAANSLGGRGSAPVLRLPPLRQLALPPHIEDDQPSTKPRRQKRKLDRYY